MSCIDVNSLLKDISDETPCGYDFEYDAEFGEIERAVQAKAEQQVGDMVIPAEEVNWPDVKNKTLSLFDRTKDLRMAIYLTRSLVHIDGFLGLMAGLALIKGLLENNWETVHPQLDPEDNNDPTLRINTLSTLSDPESMLPSIREATLVKSSVFGTISFRQILISCGKLSLSTGSDEKVIESSTIDGAFMDADIESLQETAEALRQSIESAVSIEALMMDKVGSMQMLDFSPLSRLLKDAQKIMTEHLSNRGIDQIEMIANESGDVPVSNNEEKTEAQAMSGKINSREDVIKALDMACNYFKQNEPSSPVPLLLQRAKRLVSMDFMDIIRDLTPAGVTQAEDIGGTSSQN